MLNSKGKLGLTGLAVLPEKQPRVLLEQWHSTRSYPDMGVCRFFIPAKLHFTERVN